MMTKIQILEILKKNRSEFDTYGVRKIGLFGSYSRDEQTAESDIDIYVEFEPNQQTYDNLMGLYDLLERLVPDKKIEVVTKNGMSPYIGPAVLDDVEYV